MGGDGSGSTADTTLIVVPREGYGGWPRTFAALLRTVPAGCPVIVVPGGAPRRIVRRLQRGADARVRFVGPRHHLPPNHARRLGVEAATTRYVALVDNDVRVEPGWLDALVARANAIGAVAVSSLVLSGPSGPGTVHYAGGECHLDRVGGSVRLVESHDHYGDPATVAESVPARVCELMEFHAVLLDRDRVEAAGGFDPRLLSQYEHIDLALRLRAAGGELWLEPASRVTYPVPRWMRPGDLAFFLGRWSRTWNRRTDDAFWAAHGITGPRYESTAYRFCERQRRVAWAPATRVVARVFGQARSEVFSRRVDRFFGRHLAEAALVLSPKFRRREWGG